jgi:hypothetical protein
MKRALEAWPTALGQTASNHGRKLIRPAQRHGRNDHFRRNLVARTGRGDGPLTEPTAAAQLWGREPLFVPTKLPSKPHPE